MTETPENPALEPVLSPVLNDSLEAPFQRLHPLSVILKSAGALSQNLIAIGVLYFSVLDQNLGYTILAGSALVGAVIGITALVWSRFTYQVGINEIRIKSGVLSRNNRSIPFDRIQDVSLEQKLVSRVLGLATVKLETGAGGGEDGKLDALALVDAEALRDILRDYKSGAAVKVEDSGEAEITEEKPSLFSMDNRRILIAGLFNFSFILLAVLGVIAQNLDFLLPDEMFNPWYWAERLSGNTMITDLSFSARIIGIISALLTLLAVGIGSGIIRTYIREYGFRLDLVRTGQKGFRRRRGLFTLTDMVMPIHRVQAAIIATGPVRQRFDWYHLKFQSLAGDTGGETDHSTAPCANRDEIAPILAETGIQNITPDVLFRKVSSALWWRDVLIAGLLLVLVAGGLGSFVDPGFYGLPLLALLLAPFMFLHWRYHQYALTEKQLFVRTGWWKRRLTILPIRKLQTVDISQSPLDHPLGLATITIGIAGGSALSPLKINDLPYDTAMTLRDQLIQQAHGKSFLTQPA